MNEKFIDLCFDSDIGTDLVLCIMRCSMLFTFPLTLVLGFC